MRTAAAGFIGVLLITVGLGLATPAGAQGDEVLLAAVDGPITPVVADYLQAAVEETAEAGYELLIVTIDTPGGLDVSMRDIAQTFLNSTVPVVAFVSPQGARAASAGTFITMSAHVAAMAPATSIGAATPVDPQGGEITDKIINDAVAFAVSVAERRNRDAAFAEESVRDGRSITSRQALEIGVIDLVADDLDDLLEQLDGWEIESLGITLETAGAEIVRRELSGPRAILGRLADPNLAFLFLSIGTLAIIYEAANPGLGFAGIAGVILLVLAFFALSVLPVQVAGIALFVLAVALLIGELFVPGVGVLAAGGTVALLLSGIFLFEGALRVSAPVLWPSALVLGVGSAAAGRAALRARLMPATSGPSTLIGQVVTVHREDDRMSAFIDGAWWEVEGDDGLDTGTTARVVGMDGLRLTVEEVDNGV